MDNEDRAQGGTTNIALTAMTYIFGKEVSYGRTYPGTPALSERDTAPLLSSMELNGTFAASSPVTHIHSQVLWV